MLDHDQDGHGEVQGAGRHRLADRQRRQHLGQSLYCARSTGRGRRRAAVDLDVELRNGENVRQLIGDGVATAVHDVSDGGLLVALAEMAMAGGIGVKLEFRSTPHRPLAKTSRAMS
jgi:phosphoribosylformylglycinamidine synthase